ncbi:MAG: hypothetical protein EA382_08050 [Spirochaetaceae bacterium]|nr:MAG: hypothetical protein EA382_08050 [Spirochaetaceae bacterium]
MNRRRRTAILTCIAAILAASCATTGTPPDPTDDRFSDRVPTATLPSVDAETAIVPDNPLTVLLAEPTGEAPAAEAPTAASPVADALARSQPSAGLPGAVLPAPSVVIRDDLPWRRAAASAAPDVTLAMPQLVAPAAVRPAAARPAVVRPTEPASQPDPPVVAEVRVPATAPVSRAGLPLPAAPVPAAPAAEQAAPAASTPTSAGPASTSVALEIRAAGPDSSSTPADAPRVSSSGEGGAYSVGREGLDTLSVRFPGSGWLFVGNEHSSGDVTLVEKRRVDGDDVFVFRFGNPGEYHLWFQQQQPGGVFVNERVAVDTTSAPEPARPAEPARSVASPARPAAEPARPVASPAPGVDATIAAVGRPGADDPPAPPSGERSDRIDAVTSSGESLSAVPVVSYRRSLAGMSDTDLFALAQRLERPGPDRDLRLALDAYELIVRNHPFSDAWDDGRARATYLRRHYFDIR